SAGQVRRDRAPHGRRRSRKGRRGNVNRPGSRPRPPVPVGPAGSDVASGAGASAGPSRLRSDIAVTARNVVSRARPLAYAAAALRGRALGAIRRAPAPTPVAIVVERGDWAVRWWGTFVAEAANRVAPAIARTTIDPSELTGGIVEFGSQYQWVEW